MVNIEHDWNEVMADFRRNPDILGFHDYGTRALGVYTQIEHGAKRTTGSIGFFPDNAEDFWDYLVAYMIHREV